MKAGCYIKLQRLKCLVQLGFKSPSYKKLHLQLVSGTPGMH